MRAKVSDRIPMFSRLLRSRVKRSAAGTSAATAVSKRRAWQSSCEPQAQSQEEQRRDAEHVALLDAQREAGRIDARPATTIRTNAEAATATNARSAAVEAQPRTESPNRTMRALTGMSATESPISAK